jgi:carbon-monoxide dehydrogenase large subunit
MIQDALRYGRSQRGDHDELDELVRGQGRYTSDIHLEGALHAVFVRSPMAHARIRRIETTAALALSGVQAILTGHDVVLSGLGTIRPMAVFNGRDGQPMKQAGIPVLAHDVVRHVGEAVAVVVADTEWVASMAAELVTVEWDALPAVVDPQAALEHDTVQVHEHAPGNLVLDWADGDRDQLEAAFAQAHHIESVSLQDPPMTACAMEPKAAIAHWDPTSQRFTLIAGTQGVMLVRKLLAEQVFQIPLESIRVVTPHVGGGFGAKVQTYPEYAALMLASRQLSRPVRWTATRLECFLGDTHSRNSHLQARMALTMKGESWVCMRNWWWASVRTPPLTLPSWEPTTRKIVCPVCIAFPVFTPNRGWCSPMPCLTGLIAGQVDPKRSTWLNVCWIRLRRIWVWIVWSCAAATWCPPRPCRMQLQMP